ncbi:MAG: hypothetical protein KRP56_02995 [Candidatus Methanogranum gryphiswaldense]|nr:MAG: hypothetical protein KRP56_02995 [Candidatus Methanogranum sp. U3.2.1]
MLEIRKWWPDITNGEIDCLTKYSNYEWLVFRRLVSAGIGGGKEISENDLLQSIPTHKYKKMKEAFKSLEQKGILVKKPKPTVIIYQVPTLVYTDTIKKFSLLIRDHNDLHNALVKEDIKFLKISETISLIVANHCKLPYDLKPSLKSTNNNESQTEELGVILNVEFSCPYSHRKNKIEFEITSPEKIFSEIHIWKCDCKKEHICTAYGRILTPS